MIAKVVILCALAAVAVQAFPANSRVVGGHEAEEGATPYQVSVQYNMLGIVMSHICGGSILNDRWILTAGHCFTEIPQLPFSSLYVVAGIHSLKDDGQVIKVARIIVHPDYKGGVGPNDIALFQLKSSLEFNDRVQPVGLPQKDDIPAGTSTLTGWGSTSTGILPILPTKLQTIDLPVLTYQECCDALKKLPGSEGSCSPLVETNVCTGPIDKSGEGACSGDSGGPLVIKTEGKSQAVQIGIVSWGMLPCGTLGAPSVYTQVSSHMDFITKYIN